MRGDVYKKIGFLFPQNIEILDASIIKGSRDIVKPDVIVDKDIPGSVNLTFDVLERNDGVGIQIIYAGELRTSLSPLNHRGS